MTDLTVSTLAWFVVVAAPVLAAAPAFQARYEAVDEGGVVRLEDRTRRTTVSIVPSIGNMAVSMTVNGEEILYWPFASVDAFRAQPRFSGMPFMAPWANRLDEQAFYANGRRYAFDMSLGNVRGANPIHGFLSTTDRWEVSAMGADANGAWLTSTLEFWREPAWMKQFPFAHTIRMTYRLEDGALEVLTEIENLSAEPMPVSIGFHPYFHLTDSAREEWSLSVGARTHWLLADTKLPTGETEPISAFFPDAGNVPLRAFDLDHVFGDLVRDESGRAHVQLRGGRQTIDVELGERYRAVVLYSPAATPERPRPASERGFVCIEPMAAITNAMNLAHRGLYKDLESIPPRGTWRESFRIRPDGF